MRRLRRLLIHKQFLLVSLVQGFLNCGSRPPGGSRDYWKGVAKIWYFSIIINKILKLVYTLRTNINTNKNHTKYYCSFIITFFLKKVAMQNCYVGPINENMEVAFKIINTTRSSIFNWTFDIDVWPPASVFAR